MEKVNIPLLRGNWVDLVLVIIFLIYILEGIRRGFLLELIEFLGFGISFFASLRFYNVAAFLLVGNFSLPRGMANAIGFLLVGFLAESIFSIIVRIIISRLPEKFMDSLWSKVLGVVPAFLNALILCAFLLTLFVVLPIAGAVKADILSSKIGGALVARTQGFEGQLKNIFGGAIGETLTFLTIKPEGEEKVDLKFKVGKEQLKIDSFSEEGMMQLVNNERKKMGLLELTLDVAIREVARKHSLDMLQRGYFSHYTPEGLSPFERMKEGEISFSAAGENLALAPNVELAHNGLMNSPGHRANILSSEFKRIGIGVIDGGIYGKMFTQDFAD